LLVPEVTFDVMSSMLSRHDLSHTSVKKFRHGVIHNIEASLVELLTIFDIVYLCLCTHQ